MLFELRSLLFFSNWSRSSGWWILLREDSPSSIILWGDDPVSGNHSGLPHQSILVGLKKSSLDSQFIAFWNASLLLFFKNEFSSSMWYKLPPDDGHSLTVSGGDHPFSRQSDPNVFHWTEKNSIILHFFAFWILFYILFFSKMNSEFRMMYNTRVDIPSSTILWDDPLLQQSESVASQISSR